MTGPDSTRDQNPQQSNRESGLPSGAQYPPGATYPPGAQYPPGATYPPGAQYPTGAQYPAGAQYPGVSGSQPWGQNPATGQQAGGGYPVSSRYPAPGPYAVYPTGNQYPAASPPVRAVGPGQAWDGAGTQQDLGSGGSPTGAGGFGAGPPSGVTSRSAGRRGVAPARLFGLAVAVLGGLNFIFGFLPEVSAQRSGETLSVYAVGPAYVPILLLIAGLLALAAFLPGSERSRLAVAAVSVGGAAGAIVSLGTPGSFELFANPNQVSSGLGAILLVVFGIVQAVIAVGGYVVGADTLWKPKNAAPAVGPAAISADPPPWAGPAGGSGPIDPSLVGVYSPQRTQDAVGVTYSGRGVAPWPADQEAVQQSWVTQEASSGYSQHAPGYGGPGQSVTPVSGGPASRPVPTQEEPATGPQVVVGMETGRVDSPPAGDVHPSARPEGAGASESAAPEPGGHDAVSATDQAPARRPES